MKRKYEHLSNPKENDEEKVTKSEEHIIGLTAEYRKLQVLQKELPRGSTGSQMRSSSESLGNLSGRYSALNTMQSELPNFSSNNMSIDSGARSSSEPAIFAKARPKPLKFKSKKAAHEKIPKPPKSTKSVTEMKAKRYRIKEMEKQQKELRFVSSPY